MRISEPGLFLIKKYEGFSAKPYICPAGYLTIGYGHVLHAPNMQCIDEVEAEKLLLSDVRIAEEAIERLITIPLNQHQFDALASFTFNLGAGALQRSTLRRVVNRGEHELVPGQLKRWVWASGIKLPGLIKRRTEEAYMYQYVN